jgi:UDPglucose 6-dehydrogenase
MGECISVIGLGKLGAPMAACFSAKGYRVIGVDLDQLKVDAINSGSAPVFEPGLEEMLQLTRERLTGSKDIESAVAASDVTFIVVATPSEPTGGFSLRYVLPVCERIGRAISKKNTFHLIVLTSTVMPGTTDDIVRMSIEQTSGKRCGLDFGLCYNPEFIALGSVIRDFLNPDFILIGESDTNSGTLLENIYKKVCDNSPEVARMSPINAEITKLSVNTYVTTKISFANMLARVCERLGGANVDIVTQALGFDSRIGRKYLKGAVSYGGPCFPRDNLAFAALARRVGAPADIARVTDRFNRGQIKWLADLVQASFSEEQSATGILGLTYKPNTDVVEESVGILLARELAVRGIGVMAYDPAGQRNSARTLDHQVHFANTALECIEQADVVVLATPWPEFCSIPREQWVRHSPPRTVIDCWRALQHLNNCEGIRYVCLGMGAMLATPYASASARQSQPRNRKGPHRVDSVRAPKTLQQTLRNDPAQLS